MTARITSIAVVLALLTILGCSGRDNPTTPTTEEQLFAQHVNNNSNHQLWGYWDISMDQQTGEVEILPLRGAMFNANIVKFIQPPLSPTHMLSISIDPSSDFANGYAAVDVTLRHPFPGVNVYRGFDVRGIFITDPVTSAGWDTTASLSTGHPPIVPPIDFEPLLLNADGYTRWWNPSEFTTYGTVLGYTTGGLSSPGFTGSATINPFKYFCDDLDTEEPFVPEPDKRGSFGVEPGINTRRYEIRFDNSKPLRFNYAVDASWAEPDPDMAPDYPVEAYTLSANAQEVYKIDITDAGSDVWYAPGGNGGAFRLNIEIFDWQAESSSTVIDEISSIWLQSTVFEGGCFDLLTGDYDLYPSGTDNSAIFNVEINPEFDISPLDPQGYHDLIVGVESSNPGTYEPQIDGNTGMFDYPAGPLTAWYVSEVYVSGDTHPVVHSIDPDSGELDSELTGVSVKGDYFQDSAVVIFIDEDSGLPADTIDTTYISAQELQLDLDLTGWEIGFYDVTVQNPDLLEGTLEHGFEVTQPQFGNLVLETELPMPKEFTAMHALYPAICVEHDGDVTISYVEWWQNPDPPNEYRFYSEGYKSDDDGVTWPHFEHQMNGSYFDPIVFGYSTKIWPSSTNTSWRTNNHIYLDTDPAEWWIGYADTTFDGPYWHETATYAHDIDHANEIVQDSDGYVYLFGDRDDNITFKRSELPDRLDGGPSTNMWNLHPDYTLADPGILSRVRASALHDGTSYVAYYEPDNAVRLAKMSLPDWQTWDVSTVIWDGSGSDTSDARDPGLHVDESGFHIVFVRTDNITGNDQICYTYSSDGDSFSDPVVIRDCTGDILETPVFRYDVDTTSVIATIWWEGDLIYASWSEDEGFSWADPVQLSNMEDVNAYPDFWIAESGNWHIAFSSLNDSSALWELHYLRAHLEL